jgi:hypothetical protein
VEDGIHERLARDKETAGLEKGKPADDSADLWVILKFEGCPEMAVSAVGGIDAACTDAGGVNKW